MSIMQIRQLDEGSSDSILRIMSKVNFRLFHRVGKTPSTMHAFKKLIKQSGLDSAATIQTGSFIFPKS